MEFKNGKFFDSFPDNFMFASLKFVLITTYLILYLGKKPYVNLISLPPTHFVLFYTFSNMAVGILIVLLSIFSYR